MSFVTLAGPKSDIDRVIDTYLSKYEIQLENALVELNSSGNLLPYVEANPYKDILDKSHALLELMDESIANSPLTDMSVEEATNVINNIDDQIKDLKDLPKGAKIAIPNDPTNGGRALLLLQKAGLITLKDSNNILSTVQDIASNPNGYQFVELEAAQVPRSIDDVALAAINTNYALSAGLNPGKDALFIESNDSPYVNIVTVLKGNENDPRIKKLMEALHSPEIKKFIQDKYQGAIVPAF